ncbi:hypothetical protein PQX77_009356 [Marasmius sp. AFHP31]|nr:hypothetical protein PQX77_009356 [Marasmius sp. AFHP31]
MPLNPKDPYVAIGLTSVICAIPTLLSTTYRLYIRQSRYWADDLLAFFSGLSLLLMVASTFIHISFTPGNSSVKKETMIAAYYLMAASFYSVLWFARLSMLFSIIRVHPEYGFGFGSKYSMRKVLYLVSGVFTAILVLLLCQLFWVCEPEDARTRWKEAERPQCALTRQVVVFQVIADFLSDLILVLIPIRLIRTLSSCSLRRQLAWIFSTAIITTIVSIPHATFIIIGMKTEEIIAAYVEMCIGLIVCNIPVVVTRLIKKWGDPVTAVWKSKWTSIRFASVLRVRSTENTESRLRGELPITSMPHVKATTDIVARSWFRWNPELPEEEPKSSGFPTTHHALTVDLGDLPGHEEVDSRSENRRPPLPSPRKSTVTWI